MNRIVDILQHGYKYVPLIQLCKPDWLPTETLFWHKQNVEPSMVRVQLPPKSFCNGGGVRAQSDTGDARSRAQLQLQQLGPWQQYIYELRIKLEVRLQGANKSPQRSGRRANLISARSVIAREFSEGRAHAHRSAGLGALQECCVRAFSRQQRDLHGGLCVRGAVRARTRHRTAARGQQTQHGRQLPISKRLFIGCEWRSSEVTWPAPARTPSERVHANAG